MKVPNQKVIAKTNFFLQIE